MTEIYRALDLTNISDDGESSEPVQYVGVYVLRWGREEQPEVGFIPVDVDANKAKAADDLYDALKELNESINATIDQMLDASDDSAWAAVASVHVRDVCENSIDKANTVLAKARGEQHDQES